jgi:hypothetical protein
MSWVLEASARLHLVMMFENVDSTLPDAVATNASIELLQTKRSFWLKK